MCQVFCSYAQKVFANRGTLMEHFYFDYFLYKRINLLYLLNFLFRSKKRQTAGNQVPSGFLSKGWGFSTKLSTVSGDNFCVNSENYLNLVWKSVPSSCKAREGWSVMMLSTPMSASSLMRAVVLTVQVETSSPASWAALTKSGVQRA